MYDVTNRHEQFYSRNIRKIVKISRSVKYIIGPKHVTQVTLC